MNALVTQVRRHPGLVVMILPVVAYFLVFHYTPMAGLLLAFKEYLIGDGIAGSRWVGMENFERLFFYNDFLHIIRNTLLISLLRLFCGFLIPLALALMLNEVRLSGYRNSIQSIAAMPHYFSWVILANVFLMLLAHHGPVNDLINGAGFERIGFLTEGPWFITTLITTGIWQGVGYGAIIYLAALSGISPDLYEAAEVDGADRFQKMRHVTLPALVPTVVTLFILNLGNVLNAGFDQIYNLYNPSVYDVADIIDTYVLRRIQTLDFSLSTAAGMFKSVVGMVLIVAVNSLARRISKGEQGLF